MTIPIPALLANGVDVRVFDQLPCQLDDLKPWLTYMSDKGLELSVFVGDDTELVNAVFAERRGTRSLYCSTDMYEQLRDLPQNQLH